MSIVKHAMELALFLFFFFLSRLLICVRVFLADSTTHRSILSSLRMVMDASISQILVCTIQNFELWKWIDSSDMSTTIPTPPPWPRVSSLPSSASFSCAVNASRSSTPSSISSLFYVPYALCLRKRLIAFLVHMST